MERYLSADVAMDSGDESPHSKDFPKAQGAVMGDDQ
jgi:hypothetical protein